ncbi:aldehyde dehydrogenase family protein [Echinicola jeungdonensis]|uniref:Aldehyde dehydrogenase n=1 Tax=Echinicola jeungdonensis TaxID=709343 RepID=A0ABV5J6H8_9BACT|nr:aldehyde dehydrogenase family protein [Echinicola jeungdonensis]MDN3669317.1 aldehyde dehydrogenase family protein [Echinicola jeungdonensis]
MNQSFTGVSTSRIDEFFSSQEKQAIKLRSSTREERSEKLMRLKDWIKTNQGEIRKAIYADFKKPATEVDLTDTTFVLLEINLALKKLAQWMAEKKVSTPTHMLGSKSFIHYEPKGTVLIISPWNFPFNLTIGPLVSAIAAGCTVTIKPSELTPHTSALIRRLVEENFNENEVAVFEGGQEIANLLLSKPFDHIHFIGSTNVGKMVMKAASQNLSSVTLQLGGKSPIILDKGINLRDAAHKIAFGKFMNCGQTCIAPDYLLLHESQQDLFIQELSLQVKRMFSSNPKAGALSKDYGRIINSENLDRLKFLLNDAQLKGAKIIYGGKIIENELFMEPTILEGINDEMLLMQEEIFGPILPIITYNQIEDIVNLINQKPKPLAQYIFTKENFVVDFLLKNTSSGTVCVNDCGLQFMQNKLPFGGINQSGMGKTHGYAGFLSFSNEKSVLKQRVGRTLPKILYPPYGFRKIKITQTLMNWLFRK